MGGTVGAFRVQGYGFRKSGVFGRVPILIADIGVYTGAATNFWSPQIDRSVDVGSDYQLGHWFALARVSAWAARRPSAGPRL